MVVNLCVVECDEYLSKTSMVCMSYLLWLHESSLRRIYAALLLVHRLVRSFRDSPRDFAVVRRCLQPGSSIKTSQHLGRLLYGSF